MKRVIRPVNTRYFLTPRRRTFSYPGAVVGHAAAAGQAGVKVCDAIGAADWSVLVDFTAAVHITTSGQVPLGHGEGRSGGEKFFSFCSLKTPLICLCWDYFKHDQCSVTDS